MKRLFRLLFLLCVIAFGPVVLLWIRSQGMTALNWLYLPALGAWAVLFGLWYLCFGPGQVGRRLGRLGLVLLAVSIVGVAGRYLLRYEGSASGSSFPRFSWAWEDSTDGNHAVGELVQTDLAAAHDRLAEAADEAPSFLGPDRDGTRDELPFQPDWSETAPELLWRRPLGKAWSSFVVAKGRAITQEQVGDSERVTCLDLFTGEELWHHDDPDTRLLLAKAENGGAAMGGDGPRSTPAITGDRIVSIGATGIVNCLDLESGERHWTRNTIEEFGGETQRWGIANSPLPLPDHGTVVVAGTDRVGSKGGATLVALSLESGETEWIYEGKGASYSSPRLLDFFGVPQVVSVNAGEVTGLSPSDGTVLWRFEWDGSFPKVGQPIRVGANRLLVTASYGMGSHLLELSLSEGRWSAVSLWNSNRLKTKFSSAAIVGDLAIGLDEGRLAAIHLDDGRIAWKDGKFGFGQHLLLGGHLLIQAESGDVVVGIPGPDGFEELSRLEALEGMTWNVPALAGRLLLVRNAGEAACYLLPEPVSPPPPRDT